ncbi:MAG: hypothetical protein ACI9OH_001419 [Oleispira sp.]|jgi:hypothetical protein
MQRNAYSLISRLRCGLLALLLVVPTAYGWDRDDRLAIMAADLLPAILGAQENFIEFYFPLQLKEQSELREITVHVLYKKKSYLAERTVKRVNNLAPIKGVKLKAVAIRAHEISSLNDQNNRPRQLIFIIENMGEHLNAVQESAIKNNDITYSSSIKDVEKGVAVGLSVTERVLPVINESSLSKIQLQFSPLFMRIAKKVE